MARNFKIIMIVVKDNELSEGYHECARHSWRGMGITRFDAITPETLPETEEKYKLKFTKKGITLTEKACFYSQYILWRKCALENHPILVLEHDAWLVDPRPIEYNPYMMVQFYGQHAMEAVLYHPTFAKMLVSRITENFVEGLGNRVVESGPMATVDGLLGYTKMHRQSKFALPHVRMLGKLSPVKSLIDPERGTSVNHQVGYTVKRLMVEKDRELFKLVDLNPHIEAWKKHKAEESGDSA